MTDQEAFEAWWKEEGSLKYMKEDITRAAWLAAIAHIKSQYTLCEKKPEYWIHKQGDYNEPAWYELDEHQLQRGWTQVPLYREAQS